MCESMVDIQFPTAEIWRGKKKKKETTGRKYNVRICYAGRPFTLAAHFCEPTEIYSAHSQCRIYVQTVRLNIVPSNFEIYILKSNFSSFFLTFSCISIYRYTLQCQTILTKGQQKTDGSSRFDPPF